MSPNTRKTLSVILTIFVGGFVGFLQTGASVPTTAAEVKAVLTGALIGGVAAVVHLFQTSPGEAAMLREAIASIVAPPSPPAGTPMTLAELRANGYTVTPPVTGPTASAPAPAPPVAVAVATAPAVKS